MNLNEVHLKLKMNLKFIENDCEMAYSSQFIINIQLWILNDISIIQLKYSIQFVNTGLCATSQGDFLVVYCYALQVNS